MFMKRRMKFLVLAMGVLAFTSCSKDLYDADKATEQKDVQYATAFGKKYGTIAADQDWGFGASTKAANTNSNEWGPQPAAITQAEVDKVVAWFKAHPNITTSETVLWTDFYIQQIYKGHGNMDELKVNEEHINNFNNTMGTIMLMVNSLSTNFSYANSTDSKRHYEYTIQYIDGGYYVGFDFVATGGNPNQQEAADGIYTDWIVKITPGTFSNTKRIIAEDLGAIGDFDFNDVVFDVTPRGNTTLITLQAAGGTLPLYIKVGGVQKEVHELFGVSTSTMVNTGMHTKPAVMFSVDGTYTANDVEILVQQNAVTYNLKAECGKAPQKICVPASYVWTAEQEAIDTKYPKFKNWVGNSTINWIE